MDFDSIKKTLSSQRLESYGHPNDNPFLILDNYVKNIKLCESLYPCLHLLEVSLRNHLHQAISNFVKDDQWLQKFSYLDEKETYLDEKEKRVVVGAIEKLKNQKKEPETGRVIAELNFGFWTSLFDVRYERVFWQKIIKNIFPTMPQSIRTRKKISTRLNKIRKLRNRVFHYEPIWHWKDIHDQHKEIIDVICWINPKMDYLMKKVDRFGSF